MRVGILGAGPAGTVCALSLLRGAQQRRQHHEVFLFDGKSFLQAGPRGCNMCAGVISTGLLDQLVALGAKIPAAIVQQQVSGHYFETRSGGVLVPKDPAASMCTVFRSAGPRGDPPAVAQSFDQLLLNTARHAGAVHIPASVVDVQRPRDATAPFRIVAGDNRTYEVDVLVGAFGVNSVLAEKFERLGFGYRRPETYHVCQAEMPLDEAYIASHFDGNIIIFSLGLPDIRFGALTPKARHVTVTTVGRHVRQVDLERFLQHPRVRQHFPAGWQPPAIYCHCHPRLPVTDARNPVADRLIIIGDAWISRYLKGGIESAFFTGALAAEAILNGRLSRRALEREYVRLCRNKYLSDNLYGRVLFRCNDAISRSAFLTSMGMRLLAYEEQLPCWSDRLQTQILWHIFAGDAPYRTIMRDACRPAVLLEMLRAAVRTTPPQRRDEHR